MTDANKRDYSWSLPNRRFIDSGLYLPSIRSEGIDTIAVIVDTSGSLPAGTLAEFWAEVREIASELQPERVILLQVDAAVQEAAEYAASDLPDEIAIRRSIDASDGCPHTDRSITRSSFAKQISRSSEVDTRRLGSPLELPS